MLTMMLGTMAAAALQNPLNIPMPTQQELARCIPRGMPAATPMSAITRRQINAMVACANGLVAGRINSITPAEVSIR